MSDSVVLVYFLIPIVNVEVFGITLRIVRYPVLYSSLFSLDRLNLLLIMSNKTRNSTIENRKLKHFVFIACSICEIMQAFIVYYREVYS